MTSLPNRFPSFRVIIRCRFHSGFNIKGIFLEIDFHTPMEKERKRKMNSKVTCVFEETEEVAKRHHESLASTLGHLTCCKRNPEARNLLREIDDLIADERESTRRLRLSTLTKPSTLLCSLWLYQIGISIFDSCQNRVSIDQYHLTVLRVQ